MEKIKKLSPYLASALFVAGLVIAVGFTVNAQSGGMLETIKDAVIALTAKVLNLETRVVALEENGFDETKGVGGVTGFDQIDAAWINTGDVASTTDSVWNAKPRLRVLASDSDDFWENTTGGNVWVSVDTVSLFGTASSGMSYYVATSSASTLTDFTYSSTFGPPSRRGQTEIIAHASFATSTINLDFTNTATSTPPQLLRPGEYVVAEIIQPDSSCGNADVAHGECEFATSSNRGFTLEVILNVTGTSTPLAQF